MAVILPSAYRDGTTSVTQGSTAVEGHGTLFKFSVLPGDWYSTDDGFFIMISNVVDDTHLELIAPYPGSTISQGSYSIMLQSDIARMQETTRQLLETLRNGNLVAFAGLVGSVDKIPMFTGPGAMTLINRSDLVSTLRYDETVDDLAGRAAYDGAAANFRVLVLDADGNGRAAFYTKNTEASGDWSDPLYLTGSVGPQGPAVNLIGGSTTTLAPGSQATFELVPNGGNDYTINLGLPRGTPGAGNVSSPGTSQVNQIAGFADTAGENIKGLTVLEALGSLGPVLGGTSPQPANAGVGIPNGNFNEVFVGGSYSMLGDWIGGPYNTSSTPVFYNGILQVQVSEGANLVTQVYRGYEGSVFKRFAVPGSWSAWVRAESGLPISVNAGDIVQFTDGIGSLGPATIGSSSFLGRVSAGVGGIERMTQAQARQAMGGWEFIGAYSIGNGFGSVDVLGLAPYRDLRFSISYITNAYTASGLAFSSDNGASFYSDSDEFRWQLTNSVGTSSVVSGEGNSDIAPLTGDHSGATGWPTIAEILVCDFNTSGRNMSAIATNFLQSNDGRRTRIIGCSSKRNVSFNAVRFRTIAATLQYGRVIVEGVRS